MVPIHDTDVAHERWSQAEWRNYELWEKVEVRFRKKRQLWIVFTILLFLILSSVPTALDRWPKWTTRSKVRLLAQEINQIKLEAITHRATYRIRFLRDQPLQYVIEQVLDCSAPIGQVMHKGELGDYSNEEVSYTIFNPAQASELGIPGLVTEFCYDYLKGSLIPKEYNEVVGFGIIPVKDLAEKKLDRLSILILSGNSGEISFD